MYSYISSWLYPAEPVKPTASAAPPPGFARYSNPDAPIAPASLASELSAVRLRHIEVPPRVKFFPPRDPVLQQLLATRQRVM